MDKRTIIEEVNEQMKELIDFIEWCRQEGETDIRSILWQAREKQIQIDRILELGLKEDNK